MLTLNDDALKAIDSGPFSQSRPRSFNGGSVDDRWLGSVAAGEGYYGDCCGDMKIDR